MQIINVSLINVNIEYDLMLLVLDPDGNGGHTFCMNGEIDLLLFLNGEFFKFDMFYDHYSEPW